MGSEAALSPILEIWFLRLFNPFTVTAEKEVGCEGLQDRYLYSRTNFKLNRAAALAEWRQFLSAYI